MVDLQTDQSQKKLDFTAERCSKTLFDPQEVVNWRGFKHKMTF